MSKYINKRQLAFLIFILAAFFLIRQMRSDDTATRQRLIQSSTNDAFREKPAVYTDQAQCLKQCLDLSDSSVALILKHGVLTKKGSPKHIKGNALSGTEITLAVTKQDNNNLITDIAHPQASNCLCN